MAAAYLAIILIGCDTTDEPEAGAQRRAGRYFPWTWPYGSHSTSYLSSSSLLLTNVQCLDSLPLSFRLESGYLSTFLLAQQSLHWWSP